MKLAATVARSFQAGMQAELRDIERAVDREHALISQQEHEAWEVLLACQGQVRLAPSGHVIGIDMNAALKISAARGHDPQVLSELLPAAEAGVVEALRAEGNRSN